MGKKRSFKGKAQYAIYDKEDRATKNRAAKLARHLKKHPNDEVASVAAKAKRGHTRTKSTKKGNFPDKKVWVYDGAGHKILMTNFVPGHA